MKSSGVRRQAACIRSDPEQRDPKKRPMKHKFPSGFHGGIELYGQHNSGSSQGAGRRDLLEPNDRTAGGKGPRRARQLAGGKVSLMFDCDAAGDHGAKEALWLFAQTAPDLDVRLAWSQRMCDGNFLGNQPDSLAEEELQSAILSPIRRRPNFDKNNSGPN